MTPGTGPGPIDLFEAMSTTRAIRSFDARPISPGTIRALVEAASWAPSGGNLQQWRVVVLTDPAQRTAFAAVWRLSWARFVAGLELPEGEVADDFVGRQMRASSALAASIDDVPAVAVFCHYPGLIGYLDAHLERPSVVGGASLYPAVQNFLLACRAHGLGAVLTTTICLAEPEAAAVLGAPEGVGIHAAVPFGYPRGASHGPARRRPVDRLAYGDRWGEALP